MQHRFSAVAKARGLDGHTLEGAPNLVDYQRCERFTLDVFGDDDELLACLHHLLEHRQHVANCRNLGAEEQDVWILDHRLHSVGVGHEVRRNVALVEAHTFDEIHLDPEGLTFLYGDDSVFADLVDCFGNFGTNLRISSRDCGYLGDLRLAVDFLGE